MAAGAGNAGHVIDLDDAFHADLFRLRRPRAARTRWRRACAGRIQAFLRAATVPLPVVELRRHAQSHGELVDAIASGDRAWPSGETARHIAIATERIRRALLET